MTARLMNFEQALRAAKYGGLVTRGAWHRSPMCIYYVQESQFTTPRYPLNRLYANNEAITYLGHYDIRHSDGLHGVWSPTQEDVDAEDYYEIDWPHAATAPDPA